MIFQRLFIVLLSALVAPLDAFSLLRPSSSFYATRLQSTTEGDGAAAPDEIKQQSSAVVASASMDILNSPEFLKRKRDVIINDLSKTEADLKVAQERLDAGKAEWGAQLGDLQKEYENIQQRMNTQSNKSDDMATSQVAREMLAVLDNFDRAFGQVTPSTDEEKAIEAEYRQAYDGILDIFTKLGVKEVPTLGIEFDYQIHQAVMQKPSDEYAEGIVCDELQKGFKIGDTLIRAAMVAVAM